MAGDKLVARGELAGVDHPKAVGSGRDRTGGARGARYSVDKVFFTLTNLTSPPSSFTFTHLTNSNSATHPAFVTLLPLFRLQPLHHTYTETKDQDPAPPRRWEQAPMCCERLLLDRPCE
jgi:hypothetical protein